MSDPHPAAGDPAPAVSADDYAAVTGFIAGHAAEATRLHGSVATRAVQMHVALSRAVARFERDLEREVQRAAGVGLSAYRILYTLLTTGGQQPGALAETIGITPTSASSLLRGLEVKGLITRERSDDDRRQRLVELTDEGRTRVLLASRASIARQLQWYACFEPAELDELESMLHRLLRWDPDAVPAVELRGAA